MSKTIICPVCRKGGETDEGMADLTNTIVRCNECSTLIAYGVVQPRVVIQPQPGEGDERFVRLSIGEVHVILEKSFAKAIGHNLLSIT